MCVYYVCKISDGFFRLQTLRLETIRARGYKLCNLSLRNDLKYFDRVSCCEIVEECDPPSRTTLWACVWTLLNRHRMMSVNLSWWPAAGPASSRFPRLSYLGYSAVQVQQEGHDKTQRQLIFRTSGHGMHQTISQLKIDQAKSKLF